jgi:hypothetical protein
MQATRDAPTRGRPLGITIVSVLMVVFGLAEISTGLTGNFLDVISATTTAVYTVASVSIGAFYCLAGLLVLTMKRWAAAAAVVLLGADILGRVGMVAAGLYPFKGMNATGIVGGTAIAAAFGVYIGIRWKTFG